VTRYTPLWLQSGSYPAGVDRRLIDALWPSRGAGSASASNGAAVTKVAGTMTVSIAPGAIVVPTANGTGAVLCVWDTAEVVTFAPAPGSGLQRFDSLILQPRGNDLDGGTNNDFVFSAVTGSPASSPVWPALPPGCATFAGMVIPGGVASLDTASLLDIRPGGLSANPPDTGWLAITLGSGAIPFPGLGVPYCRALGYFGYLSGVMQLTTPSLGILGVLPVGVRPPVTRLVTAMTGNGDTAGRLNINVDGTMSLEETTSSFVSLDGVTFAL
jgi:hypothetical protein